MSDLKLLYINKNQVLSARSTGGGGGKIKYPSFEKQAQRLHKNFSELEKVLQAKNLKIQADATGIVQEQVLVLRTIGPVREFADAVSMVQGLEWLAEFDEEDIPPDEDFYKTSKKSNEAKTDPLSGRLYLVVSNHKALSELLTIWEQFQKNPTKPLKKGFSGWKQVFKHLKEIRLWGPQDRFESTGILEDWNEQVKQGIETVRFQLEPWFKKNSADRVAVNQKINELIQSEGGRLISEFTFPEIAYHGLLGELPITSIKKILADSATSILHCEYIMFARPHGQGVISISDSEDSAEIQSQETQSPVGDPLVALLDGLPLQNHPLLRDRLALSDPDNFAEDYEAAHRIHGTGMASAIIYGGSYDSNRPIESKLYVRPILKPGPTDFQGKRLEVVPRDTLEVDLLHRSVVSIFSGKDGKSGEAASVRVINYSIGDSVRQYDHILSPVARMIDWLSWQYNVLFVISAGNHPGEIKLECDKAKFKSLSKGEKESLVIDSLVGEIRNRRLLSPAESLNALTVGASYSDPSTANEIDYRFSAVQETSLIAPYSAIGLGYRRSIKPDMLVPGGRLFYGEKINSDKNVTLSPCGDARAPGYCVASPSAGGASKVSHQRGTSFSAAVTSHYAEKIIQNLILLSNEVEIRDEYLAVLTKALLVHTTSWGKARDIIEKAIQGTVKKNRQREFISRFLGYGNPIFARALACANQRATILACDSIVDGQGHLFEIPLPADLSAKKDWRKLSITLSWFTPIECTQRPYRKAALWISAPGGGELFGSELKVLRNEADYKASLRGTIQHEVLQGEKAVAITENSVLKMQVNCREDATQLVERIRYGLVVSLEVKEGTPIQVYSQIRARIPDRVKVVAARQSVKP